METESIQSRMAKVLMGSNTRSYVDFGKNIYLNQLEAYGETVIVPIEPWKWELTNEKKMIGNYLCLKATTSYILVNPEKEFKKNVEAWYAPEI
ncbi:MAG: GLPGLI family protein, partial [Xanthomarina sp.]